MHIDYDIRSYCKLYKNVISEECSNDVLNNLKSKEFHQHLFQDPETNQLITRSNEQELEISYDYKSHKIEEIIYQCISNYLNEFSYPWFSMVNGFTQPRWNKYQLNRKMALHADLIKSIFDGERKGDPTLTVLGLLRSNFTGGEFTLLDDIVTNFEGGDILIFPSTFMYPHKVDPVTSGERYSFVSWVW